MNVIQEVFCLKLSKENALVTDRARLVGGVRPNWGRWRCPVRAVLFVFSSVEGFSVSLADVELFYL